MEGSPRIALPAEVILSLAEALDAHLPGNRKRFASLKQVFVIGHGNPNIAKRHNLLNSQSLVYNSDRQAPPGSSESFQRFDRWQIQADG